MRDGGPLGTDTPTPDDPDTCATDVESKHNCRGGAGDWNGTASGSLEHGNGVVETWTATYSMDEVAEGFDWAGPAAISWQIAGADSQGCTYEGQGSVDGRTELVVWTDLGTYGLDVWRVAGETVPATVDCPYGEPETEDYQLLNTNAGDSGNQLLPEGPLTSLSGTAEYEPMNGGDGSWVSYTWSATGQG